jgi:hypothetical protein
MEIAGTSHIKINFKSNIGHNSMRKKLKTLAEKTGIPLPNKGSFGAHGFCHRALTDLEEKGVCVTLKQDCLLGMRQQLPIT